jgi:hypothetical protein
MHDGPCHIDDVSRQLITVALRLGQDIEELVFGYHGPPELRHAAAALADPLAALDELDAAIAVVADANRRHYLELVSRALRTESRVLAGEALPFREHVRLAYDIEPQWTDERVFEEALARLAELTPGTGALAERWKAYQARFKLPVDRIVGVVERLRDDLRERARRLAALPDDELVDIELVSDKRYAGSCQYLGGFRSLIEINIERMNDIINLPDFVAHEAYPGHHTELCLKEAHLLGERGYGEELIELLPGPQTVPREGIAMVAFDMVVPPAEQPEWLQRMLRDVAGLDLAAGDIAGLLEANELMYQFRHLGHNVALMLHERGATLDEATAYMERYGPYSGADVSRRVTSAARRDQSTHKFSYTAGRELVSAYLANSSDREAAFRALLLEQWTPTRLRAATGAA